MEIARTENDHQESGQDTAMPEHVAALAENRFETHHDVSNGATSLLRAAVTGQIPLEAACKVGSLLGRKLKAMELGLKYGPFLP